MTVRVNKDSFNLREKLSELERPIELKGSELMKSETAQDARDLVSAGRKNIIINGDMSISQRGTSFANPASTANGVYTLDRFSFQTSNTNYTVAQDTTGPDGFSRSLKVTMGTATTLDYMRLAATIEGYNFRGVKFGTPSAEHLTLSFWVKSSLTGTFAVGFRNGDNLTANIQTSLVTTYEIHNANTWEYKTVSIPPNTNGSVSWNTGIVMGMVIMWDLGDGTSRCPSITSSINSVWQTSDNYYPIGFDETVKLASTSSATWQITGVQLEVGKNATDFEHRSIGEELALCQRYFQRIGGEGSGGSADYNNYIASGFTDSNGSNFYGGANLKVSMRTSPTITFDGTISTLGYTHPGLGWAANSLAAYWSCPQSYVVRISSATAGGSTGYGAYARVQNNNSQLNFSAEL